MRGTRYGIGQILLILGLVVLVVLTLLPFYVTLLMSQKTNGEVLNHFWSLPPELRPHYYAEAWVHIWPYIWNSLVVCTTAVGLTLFLSALGGYVFGRLEFKGKNTLFMVMVALMMIPALLTLVPSFLWYKNFPLVGGNNYLGDGGSGFLDTHWILIISFVTGGQIFGIFLCRTFFETIPNSLFESARIDGATELQAFWYIGVPLSIPILATLAIMQFVGVYNDYIWPLVTITTESKQVFAVGVTKFGMISNLDSAPQMAGYLIGAIPLVIIFSFGMKYYIEGLTKGAVKG